MVRDIRRINPPDLCRSVTLYETPKDETIFNCRGRLDCRERLDGRGFQELRPINLIPGLVPNVTGSAYIEWGNTKVMVSVHGPQEVFDKSDSLPKGQVYCDFKYATFSCKHRQPFIPSDDEKSIAKDIKRALELVILLEKFPSMRLDVHIIVLENDGAVLSTSITCAGIALSDAGVEMYALPIGCTLISTGELVLVDPTIKEEDCKHEGRGKFIVCLMPEYNQQVIHQSIDGNIVRPLFIAKASKILRNKFQTIIDTIKTILKQHVEKKCEDFEKENFSCNEVAAIVKLIKPHKYMSAHLKNNIRPDGRELKEFRPPVINVGVIGTAYGSALVQLDNTAVLCGVKADLSMPTSEEPNKGFFVPNISLMPICSSKFLPGPPGEQAQAYSRLITDLVLNSDFMNLPALCILENEVAWCLFAEIICLRYDGNILDACLLAIIAALKNTKLPEVDCNIDDGITVTDKFVPLNLNPLVFTATFAHVENQLVADPSEEEENLANGSMTISVKEDNSVSVHSFGVFKEEYLCSGIECAKDRYKEMKQLIETLHFV